MPAYLIAEGDYGACAEAVPLLAGGKVNNFSVVARVAQLFIFSVFVCIKWCENSFFIRLAMLGGLNETAAVRSARF